MKVLLSGGVKTDNILMAIQKKFLSSGDEFIVEKFIDDVGSIYARGDYFDKAIITEQSITREGSITDENEIRQRINNFAIENSRRQRKALFVFLTQREEMANIIYEEILPILNFSSVVYKHPPYSVQFFVTLVLKDVKQLPEDIVFKPAAVTSDIEYSHDLVEEEETENTIQSEVAANALFNQPMNGINSDFSSNDDSEDLGMPDGFFDELDELDDSTTDEYDNQQGSDTSYEEFSDSDTNYDNSYNEYEDNHSFDEAEVTSDENLNTSISNGYTDNYSEENLGENNISEEFDTDSNKPEYSDTNSEYESFDNTDGQDISETYTEYNDETNDVEDSNVNDYTGSDEDNMSQQYNDDRNNNNQYEDNMSSNFLPGFDEDDYSDDENQQDLYSGYTEETDNLSQGNGMNNNTDFSDDAFGFDDNDYQQEGINNAHPVNNQSGAFGFDNNDYQQGEFNNAHPVNNQSGAFDQPGMYDDSNGQSNNFGANIGFDQSDYVQDADNRINNPIDNSAQMNNVPGGFATPAKGLLGKAKFFGKKTQVTKKFGGNNNANVVNDSGANISNESINGKQTANVNKVRNNIKAFAARGNSIVVTGCGGCGTSTIAYNLANIICQLGYTVLLVDMDTDGRTQNYISRVNYESMESDGANLMAAVNSSTGLNNQMSVVKQGFHLLTMGIGADVAPVEELLHKEKLGRFINMAKVQHNFVIYDIPFNKATTFLSDVTYGCDNIVLAVDSSNWGITKMMLNVCNIASEDMQDTIFNRAQVVFNRYRNLNKVFGKKIRTASDIMKVVDDKVLDLIGDDPGFYFQKLTISGIINDDPAMEDGWFENVQYSDTRKGQNVFLELLQNIVLKK